MAACVVAAAALTVSHVSLSARETMKAERETFMLGTLINISAYGSDKSSLDAAISAAMEEISRLEQLFSVGIASSEISRINAAPTLEGGHTVSPETYELLAQSLREAEETEGAFDPTVGALVGLWGIGTDHTRVPDDFEIAELLPDIGYRKVALLQALDEEDPSQTIYRVSLGKGRQLDLGAIAKGYAADRAARIMRASGVKSALLNLGGDLVAIGEPPKRRGWRLALRDPYGGRGDYFAVITVSDSVVVTSGAYERFFEQDGVRYHHILNPATGRPAVTDLVSVSVVMEQNEARENGARCDALSTALFVMGSEKARAFLDKHKEVQAILISEKDGEHSVYVTDGLKNIVTYSDNAFLQANGGKNNAR